MTPPHLAHGSAGARLAAPRGKGRQGHQAPRAGLICHKGAQLGLKDEGDSSTQTPCKCYPLPGAVLDKDDPSAVAQHNQE